METKVKKTKALTKEDVWKGFDELRQIIKESRADWEKGMEELRDEIGRISKSNELLAEDLAEEYFYKSFEKSKLNFFGENFDVICRGMNAKKNGVKVEYDIVLINCTSICIIEAKYKGHPERINQILKHAQTIREFFPMFANHKIYLAIAALSFPKDAEKHFLKKGIAVIKQIGDTIVIKDEHLKTF